MDKNTFLDSIKEIGTLEDVVEIRTKLAELSDNVSSIFDDNDSLKEQNTKFEEDNEKLRSANMQLFLRVGTTKTEQEVIKDQTGTEPEQEKEPRKFENLFDDNGNLK